MKQLVYIILLTTIGQSYAGTFDLDTLDNWQVYNGAVLVFGGHEALPGTVFEGTLKRTDVKEIVIQFNHCARSVGDYDVTLEVTDDKGKIVLTKRYRVNSWSKLIINKTELGPLTMNSITIRYLEKGKQETDKVLGRIRFE